jgi:phytoene dehydrogenase-like protein
MIRADQSSYDAVIIGAGISGLVCGCFLAKAGMKVLIAEQHFKPGGYCTSFKRGRFTFDAAAHSFGGYRDGGNMHRILKELDLCARIKIKRYDPSDIIISPDYKISLSADVDKTVEELQAAFPRQSEKIKDFIYFLLYHQPGDFAALRNKTFKALLDSYFSDDKLKAILSIPMLGNGGLPPSLISAFIGAKIYTEFLLDGGYYPDDGMQILPNLLADRFKEFGGELILSSRVKRIKIKDNTVSSVVLEDNNVIPSKFVISNCDARQTFLKFIGKTVLSNELVDRLSNMIPSLSIFVLYLGIDDFFNTLPAPGSNLWFLPSYDIEDLYKKAKEARPTRLAEYYMVRVSPDKKTILAFVNAPFKNKIFWSSSKESFLEFYIKLIEKNTIPNLSRHIIYKEAATPYTMYRYTQNYRGAAYGWAGIPSQFAVSDFKKPSFIKRLYLTGHWTTYGQGIPGVAYLGYETAKHILKQEEVNM